jgi:hypothetical protein
MARIQGIPLSSCELVEDTYATLLLAAETGIKVTHLSMIL